MSFERSRMVLAASLCGLWLLLGLQACASSGPAREQQAATAQSAQEAEDDAKCKVAGEPGSPSYDACRQKIVEKRLADEAAQVKRREAFQKTLGEGTSAAGGL